MKGANNMKGSTKNNNQESQTYDVKVTRAKEINDSTVVFDMVVNGVTIYGCWYREGKDRNGNDYQMVSFPSHEAENGKYYNHCWFKIEDDVKASIIEQLQKMV